MTSLAAPAPWGAVWGQDEAVRVLRNAAEAAEDPAALTHAWLIVGPPGSGRSTLARAFAAALIAEPGDTAAQNQVLAGTHPDLTALRTEQVVIRIDEARRLVERAYFAPSIGRYRVIVVEDADRMTERTSNVLLKALEEPPEHTIWVLCAPSDSRPSARACACCGCASPRSTTSRRSSCSGRGWMRRPRSSPRATRSATSAWRSASRPTPTRAPAATRPSARCCACGGSATRSRWPARSSASRPKTPRP
jgi:energy-coupling factor transporter ATP-binding protein EcfA2